MHGYRYIAGTATMQVDQLRCAGCSLCTEVCPYRIFTLTAEALEVGGRDLCMESGTCARSCPVQAITVSPGVGCTAALLTSWANRLLGRKVVSDCC